MKWEMMIQRMLLIVGFGLSVCGCATMYTASAVYDVGLAEVERPAVSTERYGESKVDAIMEEGVQKYLFEDEMVRIIWLVVPEGEIDFVLENKTQHSIKLVWDEAVYVDTDGQSHRVLHTGVIYANRDSPQLPSVVARGTTISDAILPADYIIGVGVHAPLLPSKRTVKTSGGPFTEEELTALRSKLTGKTIQVLLPLEIEGTINEYIFTFRVDKASINLAERANLEKISGAGWAALGIGTGAMVGFLIWPEKEGVVWPEKEGVEFRRK